MISLHEVSIPTMIKGLQSLKQVITKAQEKEGFDIASVPDCKLAEDMLPFTFQVQTACNVAKKTVWRLGGGENVPVPDDEKTVEQLQARIDSTIKILEGFSADKCVADTEMVELKLGPLPTFNIAAKDYVFDYVLPNFFFHIQTAYCILRMKGVDLGKGDYLGAWMGKHMAAQKS